MKQQSKDYKMDVLEFQLSLHKSCTIHKLWELLKKIIHFNDPTFFHCRIVSLACSPLGGSFVCSATIENKHSLSVSSVFKHTSPDQENQGTLLLWDLKTAKLEVCMCC